MDNGGGPCWEGLQLLLVLANRPLADPVSQGGYPFEAKKRGPKKGLWVWGEDLEGGACSDNLYTSGPRPWRIETLSCPLFKVCF